MPFSVNLRKSLSVAALAAAALLTQGCSTVKLAYNQVPHLAYWQLNSYLDLTQTQTERVRDGIGDLHQWHRANMLPRHAQLLRRVQQQLPDAITAEQACGIYAAVRTQIDTVLTQAEPQLIWLASQLSEDQLQTLQKKQASSNADWKDEWLNLAPERLREQRFKQLKDRAESFYGPLGEPQAAVLRSVVAQSTFDPQRVYAERQRRQQDLVNILRTVARERTGSAQTGELVRAYLARFNASPDTEYQRYARNLVQENCAGFARLHNAMTTAQRAKAVQSVQGYAQDFTVLAAQ